MIRNTKTNSAIWSILRLLLCLSSFIAMTKLVDYFSAETLIFIKSIIFLISSGVTSLPLFPHELLS